MSLRVFAMLLVMVVFTGPLTAQSTSAQISPRIEKTSIVPGFNCDKPLATSPIEWAFLTVTGKIEFLPGIEIEFDRSFALYADCYDRHTAGLINQLARQDRAALRRAKDDLREFESVLRKFQTQAQALVGSRPPVKSFPSAFAPIYQKVLRYHFYLAIAGKSRHDHPLRSLQQDAELTTAMSRIDALLLDFQRHTRTDHRPAVEALLNHYSRFSANPLPLLDIVIQTLQLPSPRGTPTPRHWPANVA